MVLPMKLGAWLTKKKTTPEAFAALIEVDPVSVRRYIAGTRRPKPVIMTRIIEATQGDVTANDFLVEVEVARLKRPEQRVA